MLNVSALVSALCFLLFSIATCGPVRSADPSAINLGSRADPHLAGVVSGVAWRDENGNVGVRREVRDLKENYPEQWNLYLLGLARMQWKEPQQGDLLSYFGLANIHGRPYGTWGDSPGIPDKVGTMGYCPHNNMLFMGWHRPYLVLFEEQLYKAIQEYADDSPDDAARARWQAAANSFRMPYWDWALGPDAGSVPDFFMQEMIDVTYPNGETGTIWNPLYAYYFLKNIPEGFHDKWRYINKTVRWPTSDDPKAPSQQGPFVKHFNDQSRGLHDGVAAAFQKPTINQFAFDIEQVHGWMHGVIGGWQGEEGTFQGHMWPLEYSSYEPLFWLHHATVDRFFAMYQAMKPDVYFTQESVENHGNLWIENYSLVDADTKLLPFRKASGDYLSTNDVRDTTTLGYAYPDTFRPHDMSDEEHAESVQATVAQLYGSSARATLTAQRATAAEAALNPDRTFTDWSIKAQVLAPALVSFVVRFWLRGFEAEGADVDAGTWIKLMTPNMDTTSTTEAGIVKPYEGSISLTAVLLDQINAHRLQSLKEEDVVPFLNEHLQVTMMKANGADITHTEFSSFKFEVASSEAQIPESATEMMHYGELVAHREVVVKAGGKA